MLPFAFVVFASLSFLHQLFDSSFSSLPRRPAKAILKSLGKGFYYYPLQHRFLPEQEYEEIQQSILSARVVLNFFTSAFAGILAWYRLSPLIFALLTPLIAFGLLFFLLFCPMALGKRNPAATLRFSAPLICPFLTLMLPFTWLITRWIDLTTIDTHQIRPSEEIIELIRNAEAVKKLNVQEKKLIESVVTFPDRIAREVMIPRGDLFCLPTEMSIKEAMEKLIPEGYSRVPVYKENLDHITGFLLQKDLLSKTLDNSDLDQPIHTLTKPILFIPETKKISSLLQAFRKQHVHIAIVVDEYGTTAGMITLEDVLEEIVGKIVDESDTEEEEEFTLLPDGSCLIDGQMSLIDIEEEIGIKIPQEGDYDTIGGYVAHHAGTIPTKGFLIQHDDFDLKIVSSDERRIKKVRLTPRT
ncbi:MAG: HlyC/CorC family transporter [Chlamydiia bacterium]|nr:HlyC/CorC family transporter [Chlamydiia bacterium]